MTCDTGMVNRAGVAVVQNCGVLLSNRYGLDSLTIVENTLSCCYFAFVGAI